MKTVNLDQDSILAVAFCAYYACWRSYLQSRLPQTKMGDRRLLRDVGDVTYANQGHQTQLAWLKLLC